MQSALCAQGHVRDYVRPDGLLDCRTCKREANRRYLDRLGKAPVAHTVQVQTTLWSRENLAWFAGLFEGEGSFATQVVGKANYLRLQIGMTDEDVIHRAAVIAGCGRVYGPYQPSGTRKQFWRWAVQRHWHAYALTVAIYPWLHARRRERAQASLAATVLNRWP